MYMRGHMTCRTLVPLSRCTLLVGMGMALRELWDRTVGTKAVEPIWERGALCTLCGLL